MHRGTAITMSVYDERYKSLILPSKSSMNAPIEALTKSSVMRILEKAQEPFGWVVSTVLGTRMSC